jgi:hypothetical protein
LRVTLSKTRPVCNPIGARKAPGPNGRAGWVRIDSMHQGDLDGIKGVYHITCFVAMPIRVLNGLNDMVFSPKK